MARVSRRRLRKPHVRIPKSIGPRLVTALILVPLISAIIFLGGWLIVHGLLCVVCFGLLYEWAAVARIDTNLGKISYAGAGTAITAAVPFLGEIAVLVVIVSSLCVILPALVSVFFFKAVRNILSSRALAAAIGLIVSIGALVSCGSFQGGGSAIFFFMVVVCLVDTGAYFFGTYFGSHTLHQELSPTKTWEGLLGGIGLGLVACVVFDYYLGWLPLPDVWGWLCVVALAVLGDLFESALKRVADIKDTSGLLPGHGGLLDRLDSMLLAAPCAYFLFLL